MAWLNRSTSPRLYTCLKYFGLVIGCLAKFVTGSLFTFNVYSNDIKTMFNYTQTEVELQSSLLNLGLGIGFIPGILYDKFGPFWTSGAGLVVSVGSYMLLWSTTKNIDFYRTKSWLMSIYFLLCGLGSAFTYMVALNTNIINLDKRWRGTIVGLLNSFFAGSPSVFVQIYLHALSGENKYANFLLLFAILFAFADILCMIFLRIYTDDLHDDTTTILPNEEVKNSEEMSSFSSNKTEKQPCCSGDTIETTDTEMSMTLLQILRNVDFQLFSWMFVFAAAIGLVFLNNLTTISLSVGLSNHDSVLLILIPVCNALVSLTFGFLSDILKSRIPRMFLLLVSCALFTGSLALTMWKGSAFSVLAISTILCGLGTGMIWTLSPTVMSERFCLQNIGRNWGITLLLAAAVGLGIQEVFGHLYDQQLNDARGGECNGLSCVRGGLAVGLGSGILSIILCIAFIAKSKIQRFLTRRRSDIFTQIT